MMFSRDSVILIKTLHMLKACLETAALTLLPITLSTESQVYITPE